MTSEERTKQIQALDFTLNFLVNRISENQKEYYRTLQDMFFELKEGFNENVE